MIKALKKLGIEGMFLNLTKAIYNTPTANIVLNGEQMKPFPLKSGMRQGCSLTQYSFRIPSQSNKTRKRNKRIQIGKE
jgi:hypothetical protein